MGLACKPDLGIIPMMNCQCEGTNRDYLFTLCQKMIAILSSVCCVIVIYVIITTSVFVKQLATR